MHALVLFVLVVAAVIQLILHLSFLHDMRPRHPAVWESLGRPIIGFDQKVAWAILRYLWQKDYRTLNDPEFTRRASVLRSYNIGYLVLFAAILVGSFIEIFAQAF